MLVEFIPGAVDALLFDFGEDGVEGALDDVLALGFDGAFGKFYFFAVLVGVWLDLGEGVLGFLRVEGLPERLFFIVFLLSNEASDVILAKIKRNL